MAEDNITPAVNLQQEKMPNELSAAEFQQRLYAWFEDRGLLSQLRAHLRTQMINVLKDTALGQTVAGKQKQVSPKLQALNLLIAEFLLQQEYHYSLSVFSTEVPLISVLPEFPAFSTNTATNKKNNGKKWKFSKKDMFDILETLGIQPDKDEGQIIYSTYYNPCNEEPLLTCIVRAFHYKKSKSLANLNKTKENENKEQDFEWIINVNDILSDRSINTENIEEIINILKGIIDVERQRLKQESNEEFLKLELTLQIQMALKEEEQAKKLAQLQRFLDIEKEQIEKEKRTRQCQIHDIEQRQKRQQIMIRERFRTLQERERALRDKEQQIQKKEEYLNGLQITLDNCYKNLYLEQQSVASLQKKLQREIKEKQEIDKNDANFLNELQGECKDIKEQINNPQESFLNVTGKTVVESDIPTSADGQNDEQTYIKDLIKQLQTENSSLRLLNFEQQFRINELSQTAATLTHDLENSQAAVAAFTAVCSAPRNDRVVSAPPLTAPTAHLNTSNSKNGAGENAVTGSLTTPCNFGFPPQDMRQHAFHQTLSVQSSSSSDDHSPTRDILRETRERLRRLEQESNEVDRNYREFRSRQAQADGFFHNGKLTCKDRNVSETSRCLDMGFRTSTLSKIHGHVEKSRDPSCSNLNLDLNCDEYFLQGQGEMLHSDWKPIPNACTKKQQKKNMNLAQLVELHFKQAIACMANNYANELNLGALENKENEVKVEENVNEEECMQLDNQSVASSGVLGDLLGAGTSGVSLSGIETSDEKSGSQEHSTN